MFDTHLITSLHRIDLLNGTAAHMSGHEVREITLQHSHPSVLVVCQGVRGQETTGALVHHLEVGLLKTRIRIVLVYVRLALVPEEDHRSVVRASHNDPIVLHANVCE